MNADYQDTHKSNGSRQGKVNHRLLNEEVLQSAVEAAKDEVLLVDASAKGHTVDQGGEFQRSSIASSLYQRLEDQGTRFVLLKPIRATVLAASAGALLALLIEHSLKRLRGTWR
jgi:hypothetical protein